MTKLCPLCDCLPWEHNPMTAVRGVAACQNCWERYQGNDEAMRIDIKEKEAKMRKAKKGKPKRFKTGCSWCGKSFAGLKFKPYKVPSCTRGYKWDYLCQKCYDSYTEQVHPGGLDIPDEDEEDDEVPTRTAKPITKHEGKKYLRTVVDPVDGRIAQVDVYAVLEAYNVTCQATGHAIKKLLCAGERGKGSRLDDLIGAMAALNRAIELERGQGGRYTDD